MSANERRDSYDQVEFLVFITINSSVDCELKKVTSDEFQRVNYVNDVLDSR